MNIYLVKAACGVDWDETKAYVCVAKDENEASSLTSECKGLPNEINNAYTVTFIGRAKDEYDKAFIICEDVKWG